MTIKPFPPFETERLIIRPTYIEDAEFILALLNSPKWKLYIGDRNVNTIDDAVTYIKGKMLPQLERLGFSNNTIIRKSDGMKIGGCGLYDREGVDGVDIGFSFLPKYEKNGYAYEASKELIVQARDLYKIEKIQAITVKENIRSQKLIEKLGLHFEKMIHLPNEDIELMLYKMLL